MVSSKERQLAQLMDRDRAGLERLGIRAATRIGFRSQQAAMAALRGRRNPAEAMAQQLQEAVPLLTDAMVAGHLKGRWRAGVLVRASRSLALRRVAYDLAIAALQKRLELGEEALTILRASYTAEAIRVITAAENRIGDLIQKAMATATSEGMHVREGRKLLAGAFEAGGVTPNNSFTLEAIFRTQTQLAYGAGRWQMDQDEAIQEILWGYKYVTVGDDRVRPEHVGFDDTTLPKDDPFWGINWPPNGWACRCAAIPVFEPRRRVQPKARDVDGKIVAPKADKGFEFNPGHVFGVDLLQAV